MSPLLQSIQARYRYKPRTHARTRTHAHTHTHTHTHTASGWPKETNTNKKQLERQIRGDVRRIGLQLLDQMRQPRHCSITAIAPGTPPRRLKLLCVACLMSAPVPSRCNRANRSTLVSSRVHVPCRAACSLSLLRRPRPNTPRTTTRAPRPPPRLAANADSGGGWVALGPSSGAVGQATPDLGEFLLCFDLLGARFLPVELRKVPVRGYVGGYVGGYIVP